MRNLGRNDVSEVHEVYDFLRYTIVLRMLYYCATEIYLILASCYHLRETSFF